MIKRLTDDAEIQVAADREQLFSFIQATLKSSEFSVWIQWMS